MEHNLADSTGATTDFWQGVTSAAAERREASRKSIGWFHETMAKKAIDALARNNMKGFYAPDRPAAFKIVMGLIPQGATVAYGGSITLTEVGILDAVKNAGFTFIDPWEEGINQAESMSRRRRGLLSDVFLSGTNALTLDGKLVNVDGLGNRVAALVFGPKRVIVVAGINKLVKDTEEAFNHIRRWPAPSWLKATLSVSPAALPGSAMIAGVICAYAARR